MNMQRALHFKPFVNTALMSNILVGALIMGGAIVGSIREIPTVLTISVVVGAVLTAAIEHWRANTAYRSLRRRQEELERLQSEFIQNVNHELRQPLTLVRGYVEMLTKSQLDEETRWRLSSMALAQTIDLVERVEAITTYKDVPQGEIKPEWVNVLDLTQTALKMSWQKAYRAGITLHLDGPASPPAVVGDPSWLLEALKQLLDNAIKFSPEGGPVVIRIYTTFDEVCLEVKDQGVGIPPAQLERIFTPFYQADGSPSRRFGGVGLGLSIVQSVARAHAGRVWVKSTGHSKGSTFTMALPLTPPSRLMKPVSKSSVC